MRLKSVKFRHRGVKRRYGPAQRSKSEKAGKAETLSRGSASFPASRPFCQFYQHIAAPIIAEGQKTFCFPENKKRRFLQILKPLMGYTGTCSFNTTAKPTCLKRYARFPGSAESIAHDFLRLSLTMVSGDVALLVAKLPGVNLVNVLSSRFAVLANHPLAVTPNNHRWRHCCRERALVWR